MSEKQKKITYLLGAGASANVLPIVAEIPDRLREFHKELEQKTELQPPQNEKFNDHLIQNYSKLEYFQDMLEKIAWLANETQMHASVDTLARKYYLTKFDGYLRQLKAVLTLYFLWEELRKPPDARYDTYIASICNGRNGLIELPDHVAVLSWNYDFQFEKAFSSYFPSDTRTVSLSFVQEQLNVIPRKSQPVPMRDGFCLVKMNGTAALAKDSANGTRPIFEKINWEVDRDFVEYLTDTYARLMSFQKSLLNFAWEIEGQTETFNAAKAATLDTNVLVVVGYSFPFFNRDIDRTLIGKMNALEKVYFQAKEEDVEANIERFESIRPDFDKSKLKPVKGVDQFFLPPEL